MVELLDERGRVFGLVNVVDLLVVLLAAILVAGGVAVIFGEPTLSPDRDPDRWTTRYATVSTTAPLYSDVTAIGPGVELSPPGNEVEDEDEFRVTDVYRSFGPNGSARLVFRVSYELRIDQSGRVLNAGESIGLSTDTATIDATVLAVNDTSADFDTRTVPVTVRVDESVGSLRDVESGDRATVGGEVVATIRSIESGSTGEAPAVTAEIETWRHDGYRLVGTDVLRIGQRVTLVTNTTIVRGHVAAMDASARSEA